MATAKQNEIQLSKSLRRSERSRTQLHLSSPDQQEAKGKNKGYKLDKQNVLSKKIDKCNSKHIDVTLKAGNLYIELSTVAYEVFRTKLKAQLFTTPFTNTYHTTQHQNYEERGLQVEDIYKIYKKKADGTYGKQSKSRTQEIDNDQKQQNEQLHQIEDQQQTEYSYKCPISNEEAGNNTIACEECNEWFHYVCLKLTEMEVRKFDPSITYICELCNNEAIFRETITNPDTDSQPLSTNKKVQQQPIGIEEKKESKELGHKTNYNLLAKVHTNDQEMENDRRTTSKEYTENYMVMNTSPKGKESSKQFLDQIEDQTYMKQPLIDTTENRSKQRRDPT
ncbi:unnamed protein product [Mytilus coruscus]|uniref:PHD-type domain-containing protein n=1 Tax=Mytilus coruscus TaxID=42192 RepID=A0A6J8A949_MYTCO|nr:unnamed protein product [Mytilus coruscus]